MVCGTSIQKSYSGTSVLKSISFEIKKGCITALAGPNGAGKTTLLKIIAKIQKPDSGELNYDSDVQDALGYVPQQNAFFYELTVEENLKYWMKNGRAYKNTVELLELAAVLKKRASTISGGMQRRLNMAIALIDDPQFLIMDEPLTGVDITTRQSFLQWMLSFKQKGMTILYSTHHTDEIEGIADELILMKEGEAVYCGEMTQAMPNLENFISAIYNKFK